MINNVTNKYNKVKGIYKIVNIVNNKLYIGSSVNMRKRILDHIRDLRNNKHINRHLQNSYNLYGDNNFYCDVMVSFKDFYMPEKILRMVETVYIQYYKSYVEKVGYNFERVGSGTTTESFSEERKRNISRALKGRIAHNKGVAMTEEQKQKLSKINILKHGKPVLVYDIFGNFVERFDSVANTARKYGVIKRDIIDVCMYRISTCKNHIFRYEGSFDPGLDYWVKRINPRIRTASPFFFELENQLTGEITKLKLVYEVEKFLKCYNKDKKLNKALRPIYDGKTAVFYKGYKIKFVYALSWSDPTKELRQPL